MSKEGISRKGKRKGEKQRNWQENVGEWKAKQRRNGERKRRRGRGRWLEKMNRQISGCRGEGRGGGGGKVGGRGTEGKRDLVVGVMGGKIKQWGGGVGVGVLS